ncbi:hypothetical protein CSB37_01775 [bacterium DOLZORAL124_38_8]|nr:MAG: hypothetical protein CSB37_01775 [bacterium DOLZORAL124_38_8]
MRKENRVQRTIKEFANNKSLLYKDKYQLPDHEITFDCLGFVIAVYETLNLDKKILRFSTPLETILETAPNTFEDLEIGDALYFFIRNRNKKRNYQRSFHHLAIKYSSTEIAHIGQRNKPVRILKFKDYKHKELLLTKSLIKKIINGEIT